MNQNLLIYLNNNKMMVSNLKRKILYLFFAFVILVPCLSACDKTKPMIVLSSRPITQESFYPEKVFAVGSKIAFGVYNPEGYKSSLIRLQILKSGKYVNWGYNIEHARDIEIDNTKNYFINDFYIHKTGYYIIRVFSHDDMQTPLVEGEFWVK